MHSAVFMPHWQEQSSSRRILSTAFFWTGVRSDRSTLPRVSAVFQASGEAVVEGVCAPTARAVRRHKKAMRNRMPLLWREFRLNLSQLRVQEAFQIFFVHRGFARRNVAEFAGFHPVFELIHQAEQMVERIHDEQQRLVVIDLETLIDGPFELDRIALYFRRFDGMRDLAIRTQQATAVDSKPVHTAHQAKLDGEPEKPCHGFDDAGEVM